MARSTEIPTKMIRTPRQGTRFRKQTGFRYATMTKEEEAKPLDELFLTLWELSEGEGERERERERDGPGQPDLHGPRMWKATRGFFFSAWIGRKV